jgi:acyl-coenzyme A thioesterase PaaI-like protein
VSADRSWATSLGMDWSAEPPGLVSTFTPKTEHRGPPGFLHGGLAAAAMDETMAALSIVVSKTHSVTAKLSLRYRQPVPLDGQPIRIEAWWGDGREGRRVREIRGRLLLADGSVAVEAVGLFAAIDAAIDAAIEKEADGG